MHAFMGESVVLGLVAQVLNILASEVVEMSKVTRKPQPNTFLPSSTEIQSEQQIQSAKNILDQEKNLSLLHELAEIVNAAEIFLEYTKYASKHVNFEENHWIYINKCLEDFSSNLKTLISQLTSEKSSTRDNMPGKSSTSDNEVPAYDHKARTCLLFLSLFPDCFVFNRSRVTRLLVIIAHIVFNNGKDGPTLEQLAGTNRLKKVGSITSLDGSNAPHFLIGDNVKEQSETWPELVGFCKGQKKGNLGRFSVIDASTDAREGQKILEKIEYKPRICSLICLGTHAVDVKIIREFKLLRILSLRRVKLTNQNDLKLLCLLQYLDLKHSNVRDCDWLEGLEKLEMLDLRYTYVKEIPDKFLENLEKLQCLLLGYVHPTGLKGAKLNIRKLNNRKNLKILRKIKWSVGLGDLSEVSDLSVTDLETEKEIKDLWDAVKKLEHLTSLGVAAAHTVDLLGHCEENAMGSLQRLRMEGKFISGIAASTSAQPNPRGLHKLKHFQNLIDLTLAPSQPIDVNVMHSLATLLCLRLYCVSKEKTMTFKGEGFDKLKKLVIGNMKTVENIHIGRAMVKGLDTLKLCDLPMFKGMLVFESKLPFLRFGTGERKFEQIESQKTVLLKDMELRNSVHHSPNIVIWIYEKNKQCYQKKKV